MRLIHHHPWELMSSLSRDVDKIFRSDAPESFVPAVDIYEEAERFVVQADLPGVDVANIDITVDSDLLTIKGERDSSRPTDDADLQRAERASGRFERSFRLPETASGSGVEADYNRGVLTIAIPKAEQAKPYRIEVTAN